MSSAPNNRNLLARRQAVVSLASVPLAAPLGAASAQPNGVTATPSQTLGPFYPRTVAERPKETDPDLVVVQGGRVLTQGVPLYLTGRVLTRAATPVGGAVVEIWQCDARALYHHPDSGDPAGRDPYFQGYGQTRTDAAGVFHFRTIRPVPYPGRTAHIHVRVRSESSGSLATQLYLPNEPGNDRDVLYRRLEAAERARVALELRPTSADHSLAVATREMASVDLVLG